MKFSSTKILLFIVAVSLVSACSIFNPDIQVEKRIALYFEVDEIAEDLQAGEDTLRVDEFKFSIGQFNLKGDDIELGSSNSIRAFIFGYDENATDERLVIGVGLTIADNAVFNSYTMFLRPVAQGSNIVDDDFIGSNGNYSIIIKGTYNGKNFTYRSKANFTKELTFEDVKLNDDDETIVIIKSLDLKDVFYDENDNLIDPTNSDNSSQIIENIENSLTVEAFASNVQ
ncbi:MAG: hypothetical protein JJ953_06960 [Gracilimonas sp.]|uniref:hypothetical protein n=1 Tax=Gracilimonas TaxID=649462 RepID=UPI001B241675|nr:hypothetical protein [Gracilimonas sp.]MBO6585828.1 hypothetical protein [Gracilimonas sp.]MBO6616825.1 hypothetical protein [Gracilimonas sp.]